MIEAASLLSYLCDTTQESELSRTSTLKGLRSWRVPFEDVCSGGLSNHLTREILLSYSSIHRDVAFGETGVPIVCALRSLRHGSSSDSTPILMVRGLVDANGALRPNHDRHAWIPRDFIAGDDYRSSFVHVCDIDTYRAHEKALRMLPHDGTWQTVIQRSIDLFDAVNGLEPQALNRADAELDSTTCILFLYDRPIEQAITNQVLVGLEHAVEEYVANDGHESKLNMPLRRLLFDEVNDGEDPMEEELPDDVLLPQKMVCGVPDGLHALSQTEHEVLSSFIRGGEGEAYAVKAPMGTHGQEVALAAMANLMTEHALRGDDAPSMACVASLTSIDAMLGILSSRTTRGQIALTSRWIPRIAIERDTQTSSNPKQRVLGPLQALFLVHTSDGSAPSYSPLHLTQPYGHPYGGDVAVYSDEWYIPKASIYFLDCVSGFFGHRIHSLSDAYQQLSERLRIVDQERSELIDAYAGVCKATELLKRRDDLTARIGRLRRGHTLCRERLKAWERFLRENPPRRPLLSKGEPDQSALISQFAQKGEFLAENKVLIEDVCHAYKDEIVRIENSIDRLRGASGNLSRRIRNAAPSGTLCSQIIARLSGLCGLTAEQTSSLEASIDGSAAEVSMGLLDSMLDQTIRPAEFWLAVHVYECRWLERYQPRQGIGRRLDHAPLEGIKPLGMLCPFSIVPSDTAVGSIEELTYGVQSLDLLAILDADTVDLSHGLALATHAKRLLVLGPQASLGPIPQRGSTFDELQTVSRFSGETWNNLKDQGLCSSAGASLLQFALDRPCITTSRLSDTYQSYGEIDDLRQDMVSEERLSTRRAPANSADDPGYRLQGIVPTISHVLVPDSAWEQCGSSKQNNAEALALGRWLTSHMSDILARYRTNTYTPLVLLTPYSAQKHRLTLLMAGLEPELSSRVDVRTLAEAYGMTWPVTILCTTCGPEALLSNRISGSNLVIDMAAATATDALVVFCGGAWVRSTDKAATTMLSRAHRIGRLFSVPRQQRTKTKPQSKPESQDIPHAQIQLREKPLSITALLNRLRDRGDISTSPSAKQVNTALMDVGLIERVTDDGGRRGWRPTAAGREVGILATKDRMGNPFCAYSPMAEPVVASVVEAM